MKNTFKRGDKVRVYDRMSVWVGRVTGIPKQNEGSLIVCNNNVGLEAILHPKQCRKLIKKRPTEDK